MYNLIVAIGQNIETEHFEKAGLPVERGKIMLKIRTDSAIFLEFCRRRLLLPVLLP